MSQSNHICLLLNRSNPNNSFFPRGTFSTIDIFRPPFEVSTALKTSTSIFQILGSQRPSFPSQSCCDRLTPHAKSRHQRANVTSLVGSQLHHAMSLADVRGLGTFVHPSITSSRTVSMAFSGHCQRIFSAHSRSFAFIGLRAPSVLHFIADGP